MYRLRSTLKSWPYPYRRGRYDLSIESYRLGRHRGHYYWWPRPVDVSRRSISPDLALHVELIFRVLEDAFVPRGDYNIDLLLELRGIFRLIHSKMRDYVDTTSHFWTHILLSPRVLLSRVGDLPFFLTLRCTDLSEFGDVTEMVQHRRADAFIRTATRSQLERFETVAPVMLGSFSVAFGVDNFSDFDHPDIVGFKFVSNPLIRGSRSMSDLVSRLVLPELHTVKITFADRTDLVCASLCPHILANVSRVILSGECEEDDGLDDFFLCSFRWRTELERMSVVEGFAIPWCFSNSFIGTTKPALG
ncbi:hypothetical protein C8R44DRAFT_742622 [Mycena epipterygia]|nr:hypothetical protein C8R44DRAFT_742622 [Mycena epipterygia]